MRDIINPNLELGGIDITAIEIDHHSRDDMPAVLLGLQTLYRDPQVRERLFALLETEALPGVDLNNGRPGMALWPGLVMAVVKQALNCDFDRLHDQVRNHVDLQRMMGHGSLMKPPYTLQQVVDNVNLFSAELLDQVSALVVEAAHRRAGHQPGEALKGRCDSFVAQTDVHYPTDTGLLNDAARRLLGLMHQAQACHQVSGWRQYRHLQRKLRGLYNGIRQAKQAKADPAALKEYLSWCDGVVSRVCETRDQLMRQGVSGALLDEVVTFLGYAEKLSDQVVRRLQRGEQIPHSEKIFSVFEPHTRWIVKGKAGVAVELGVPVCIVEDQHQLILCQKVMWEGGDVDHAVPVIKETLRRHPDLNRCSFDRGFHSPAVQRQLQELLTYCVLPVKGRRSQAVREREGQEWFREARRQHPAVESAINSLRHRGLVRVRSHGAAGFARTVALSVLAYNVHRYGVMVRDELRARERRKLKRAA